MPTSFAVSDSFHKHYPRFTSRRKVLTEDDLDYCSHGGCIWTPKALLANGGATCPASMLQFDISPGMSLLKEADIYITALLIVAVVTYFTFF